MESNTEGVCICDGTLGLTESDESVMLAKGKTCSTSAKVFKSSNTLTMVDVGLFEQSISTIEALPLIGWTFDLPVIPSDIPTRE